MRNDARRDFFRYRREVGRQEHQSCGRKIRFDSQKLAERAAMRQEVRSGRVLSCYECRFCKGWHLTKQPSGRVQERDRRLVDLLVDAVLA